MRNGATLTDWSGTLTGTLAVVAVREEYGSLDTFKTIVDVGANVGCFAIYAAHASPDARIFCFEPEASNYGNLSHNITANQLDDRVSAFQFAVAARSGKRSLALNGSLSNSFDIAPANANRETVDCTTLSEIIASQSLKSIDLLKLNCEGAEHEILASCTSEDFARIRDIRLEYHNIDDQKRNGDFLLAFLTAHGYRILRFTTYLGRSGFIWAKHIVRSMMSATAILPAIETFF
jgi:FkbM family methyltransferase